MTLTELARRKPAIVEAVEDRAPNDPIARRLRELGFVAGEEVEVVEAIAHGSGRVKVGDSVWTARGPDSAVGAIVRISGVRGAELLVEPLIR